MKIRIGLLSTLFLLSTIPFASAQESMDFLVLGTDPAGDADGTGIDDIVGVAIRTNGDDLEFELTIVPFVAESGTYCWFGGFEAGEEFLALVCAEFAAGQSLTPVGPIDWTFQADSSRGTNVAYDAELNGDKLIIKSKLSAIGVKAGDEITDIYAMTYLTRALLVDDAAPNAKSTATAAESFGTYVIGRNELGPIPPPSVGEILETITEDVDAVNLNLAFSYTNASKQDWVYNWTNNNPTGNLNVAADITQGSVQFEVLDQENVTVFDTTLEATFEQNQTFEGFEGNWTVRVSFVNFIGNATMGIFPDLPFAPAPVVIGGAPVGGEDSGNETFEGGNAQGETKDSPGVPFLLAILGLAFVALRRRA